MPVKLENCQAMCDDCQQKLEGGLEIAVSDFMMQSANVSGPLFRLCCDHHDARRVWGREDLPQHEDFHAFEKNGQPLGEFRVSSEIALSGIALARGHVLQEIKAEAASLLDQFLKGRHLRF